MTNYTVKELFWFYLVQWKFSFMTFACILETCKKSTFTLAKRIMIF